MDSRSFNSQAETFESSSRTEPWRVFTRYHPQFQPECSVHQDDQHASFIFSNCECLGESAYYASLVSKSCFRVRFIPRSPYDRDADFSQFQTNPPTNFDASGGYMTLNTLGFPEHDQFFAQHAWTIPPGKMSIYSELMPHVVAHK